MPPTPMAVNDGRAAAADINDLDFDLDFRVIEAEFPIAKFMCDTSDQCGSTCSGSACNSSANEPF
jgi:FxLD family lantipeptide